MGTRLQQGLPGSLKQNLGRAIVPVQSHLFGGVAKEGHTRSDSPGELSQLLQMDLPELAGAQVASREQLGRGYLPLLGPARVRVLDTTATGP